MRPVSTKSSISCNGDILAQLQMYRDGILTLDELVTTTYTLDEVA